MDRKDAGPSGIDPNEPPATASAFEGAAYSRRGWGRQAGVAGRPPLGRSVGAGATFAAALAGLAAAVTAAAAGRAAAASRRAEFGEEGLQCGEHGLSPGMG